MLTIILTPLAGAHFLGANYYLTGNVVTGMTLSVMFKGRWKTKEAAKKALILSIAWPMTLFLLFPIIKREERWRKTRIIREVMES